MKPTDTERISVHDYEFYGIALFDQTNGTSVPVPIESSGLVYEPGLGYALRSKWDGVRRVRARWFTAMGSGVVR